MGAEVSVCKQHTWGFSAIQPGPRRLWLSAESPQWLPPTPRDFPPGAPCSAPCPPPGSGQPRGTERMQCSLRFWEGLSPVLSPHPQPVRSRQVPIFTPPLVSRDPSGRSSPPPYS